MWLGLICLFKISLIPRVQIWHNRGAIVTFAIYQNFEASLLFLIFIYSKTKTIIFSFIQVTIFSKISVDCVFFLERKKRSGSLSIHFSNVFVLPQISAGKFWLLIFLFLDCTDGYIIRQMKVWWKWVCNSNQLAKLKWPCQIHFIWMI